MHVKEHVKEFVHDVKRKFSSKHNRDSTCSTCCRDMHDCASSYSSSDTTDISLSSSSASSLPSTPQRKRLTSFLHRSPSSHSKQGGHRLARVGSKRYRLFSAPSVPSMHAAHSTATESTINVCEQHAPHQSSSSQEDYPDVIDVSARSVTTDSTPEGYHFRDSASQSQPSFDPESRSDTSGTLTMISADFKKSISDSDSPFDSIHLQSDDNSAALISITPTALDSDVPPSMSESEQPPAADEEITLVQPTSSSSPVSVLPSPSSPVPQASRPQPPRSTPASPAPLYIPRLTVPSMFLPIPNISTTTTISHIHVSSPTNHPPSTPFEASINDWVVPPSPHVSTDPLSALLTKYVPAEQRPRRDVVGEYAGRDIHEMVMSNSWRALARMARDRIVASDPEDLTRILDLWSLRLSSLARLRLTNQASAECTNLFAVLNAVHPTSAPGSFPGSGVLTPSSPAPVSLSLSPSGPSGLAQLPGTPSQKPSGLPGGLMLPRGAHELVHPFELTLFHARVHYWSGDALGYVDALSRILGQCKEKAREEGRVVMQRRKPEETRDEEEEAADTDTEEHTDDVLAAAEANLSMWLERISRVCLILASQLIEMNDYQAAINLLAPLCTRRTAPTPELHSALARVYLLGGNLVKAEEHFTIAAGSGGVIVTNTALLAAASGDWTRAEEVLAGAVAKHPDNFTAINNLVVTLLCQGRIKEGIDLLEGALNTSPSSVVVAEPFLFNLSTLYELRSAAAIDKKRELLIKVAQWSGDGLKTSCLKMPSS